MFARVKKYLQPDKKNTTEEEKQDRIQIATCVLLLEIAKSDDEFSITEQKVIKGILTQQLEIAGDRVDEILEISEADRQNSVDLFEYTNLINQNFSQTEKTRLLEMIWRVIYADGRLDQYEDHLVHKLAELLRLPHEKLIEAKLKMRPKGYKGR